MQSAASAEEALARKREERQDLYSYIWGIVLALLLTLLPFALVWAKLPRVPVLTVVGVFALLQIGVHFRFFLHIGWRQKREDLQLLLFSGVLLAIMVSGTLWIMASLALRMH